MIKKIKSLRKNKEFSRYFQNTSWLFGEKILKILITLFVGILLAKYLGPEKLGYLYYCISIVALLGTLTHLGLSGLVVREIVDNPSSENEILGTAFYMKVIASIIGFLILMLINIFTEELYSTNFWTLFIFSFIILFAPFEIINFWFDSKVLGKYFSISSSIAVVISNLIKIFFIIGGFSLIWFSAPYLLEILLLSMMYLFFFYKHKNILIFNTNFSLERAKVLLSKSWMIMLGTIFSIIYLKIDQIMLKWMAGTAEVGIYAVAASLSEVWYFIPMIIVSSLFPKIIELKKNDQIYYEKKLQQLFDFLFFLALMLAIVVTLIGSDLVTFLYGKEFSESGYILMIHIWAGVFVFMRALFSKWILVEDVLIFSLVTQGLGALSNVILNLILIPKYGAYGAAIATLISYATASYMSLIFYSKTRNIFFMMTKALFTPIRYLFLLKGNKNV
jgi:O-antigen/teichoic acid export membrane protein